MRLKYKILLLAVVPLLASVSLILVAVQIQQRSLASSQREQLRVAYMAAKETELRHYVRLAQSTIAPLYATGRDDDEIKQEAMRLLANLEYGDDGYYFLYRMDGVNLMHPRQPELVGRNLAGLRDARGEPTIQKLLDRARAGGGFVVYDWQKPSSQVVTSKLGFVTQLPRWNWMFGSGLYLDDIDAFMRQLDGDLAVSATTTLAWIAGAGGIGVALIFGCMLLLSFSEYKVSDAKLTLLARQVVGSQEEERAHLSRELHDGTGQTLVSVKLLIESALDRMENDDPSAKAPLARALERLKDALVEVRGMSHRLRPVMLDTLGLPAALQSLGLETCSESGIVFSMEVEGEPYDLPDDIKTVLFRITQEALTNIQKHAASSHVSLHLVFEKTKLRLSIHDDGRGFDVEGMRQHPSRGIGLRNMRERIEAVGGQLMVQSQPGLTRITAELSVAAIRRFTAAPASGKQ